MTQPVSCHRLAVTGHGPVFNDDWDAQVTQRETCGMTSPAISSI
jgi:hypothetical protein